MVCCCCAWCHLFRPNDTGIKRVQPSNFEGLLDDFRCKGLFEGSLNRLQECPLVHGAIGVPCPIIKDLGIPPLELREPQYIQGCTMNESVLGCNKESQYVTKLAGGLLFFLPFPLPCGGHYITLHYSTLLYSTFFRAFHYFTLLFTPGGIFFFSTLNF